MTSDPEQELAAAHARHLELIQRRYDTALEQSGYQGVVIGSGATRRWFLDDQDYPYKPDPHFTQWVPLLEHPGSCIYYERQAMPVLIVLQAHDYWHQPPSLPPNPWLDGFHLHIIHSPGELAHYLPDHHDQIALLGEPDQWPLVLKDAAQNPPELLQSLDYHQAC